MYLLAFYVTLPTLTLMTSVVVQVSSAFPTTEPVNKSAAKLAEIKLAPPILTIAPAVIAAAVVVISQVPFIAHVICVNPSPVVFSSHAIPPKGSLSAALTTTVFGSVNFIIVPIGTEVASAIVLLVNSVGVSIHTASLAIRNILQ